MRYWVTRLMIVLTIVMSVAASAVQAETDFVSGEITSIVPRDNRLTISDDNGIDYLIMGFPFEYLEREFDIVLSEGDCVTIEYAVEERHGVDKNIAVALTVVCPECDETCSYYDGKDEIVFREYDDDGDLKPVDKSENDGVSAKVRRKGNRGKHRGHD